MTDTATTVVIEKPGYEPVECEKPLPCPFCGSIPELAQLAHTYTWQRKGRSRKQEKVRVCILASSGTLKGDTFWFKCETCGCSSGKHHDNPRDAAISWNTQIEGTVAK